MKFPAANPIPIKEMPGDGRVWRVDWFGGVSYDVNVPTEPKIGIFISPVTDGVIKNYASQQSVCGDEQKIIHVGVGQLPLLSIGSLWKNKLPLSQVAGERHTFKNIHISKEKVQQIKASHKFGENNLINRYYYRLGAGLNANCLAIEYEGDPFGIIVPTAELIRFYYATSSDLSKAIFKGDFKHALDSIVNLQETAFNKEEREFVIKRRKHFDDVDSLIIARILSSPLAKNSVDRIHDSLIKAFATGESFGWPESYFPFKGTTNWKALIKRLPYRDENGQEKWTKLVLSIQGCSAPFPYESIVLGKDNDNTRINHDDEQKNEDDKPAYIRQRDEATHGELQSAEEPDISIQQVLLSRPVDRFSFVNKIDQIEPVKDSNEYINTKATRYANTATSQLGTGDGSYQNTGVTSAQVQTGKKREKALEASFELINSLVKELNTRTGITATIRTKTPDIAWMPFIKPSGQAQWSYKNSRTYSRRAVVIVDIEYQGCWYSLVEFEHRAGDSFPMGLLAYPSGLKITNDKLKTILTGLSFAQGTWGNVSQRSLQPVQYERVKHSSAKIEALADNIFSKIKLFKE